MFKKMVALVMVLGFVVSCTLGTNIPDDKWSILTIKNASRGLGYAIANTKTTVDDVAVVQAYNLFKTGTVDPVKMNEILAPFIKDEGAYKLVVLAAFDLIEAMGGVVINNQIVDLSKITPEMWKIVETAYLQGYEIGKSDRAKGVTRAIP